MFFDSTKCTKFDKINYICSKKTLKRHNLEEKNQFPAVGFEPAAPQMTQIRDLV